MSNNWNESFPETEQDVDLPNGSYNVELFDVFPTSKKFAEGDFKTQWGLTIKYRFLVSDGAFSGCKQSVKFTVKKADGSFVKPVISKMRVFGIIMGSAINSPSDAIKAGEEHIGDSFLLDVSRDKNGYQRFALSVRQRTLETHNTEVAENDVPF